MKEAISIFFFIFLVINTVLCQTVYQPIFKVSEPAGWDYLDSLESLYISEDSIHTQLIILNDLAYYWHTRNLNKADSLAQWGIIKANEYSLPYVKAKLLVTYGAILLRVEKLNSAEAVLLEALNVLDKKDWPLAYTQLGYVEERRGNLDSAIYYANLNYDLGMDLNDLWTQAMALSDLSNLFWKQGKFRDGIEYGLQSLSLFEKRGIRDLDYDFTLYIVGMNYLSLGDLDTSHNYLSKSIELGERYGFYNNLSDAYISMIGLYTETKAYVQAEQSFRLALHYARLLDNAFLEMRVWLAYGRLLNREKKPLKAIQSLKNSLARATGKFGDNYWLSEVYEQMSLAYAASGNYRDAYLSFMKHSLNKDTVLTADSDKRISEWQTLYKTAQKEATIQLQQSRISRQNMILCLVLSILFLTLISSFFLYHLYKRLSIRNREKDFLLKEIHHRVKNNLQILSSLLSLQSEYLQDEKAMDAIQEGRHRVESMGLIHQRLFTHDHITGVNINDYVEELCCQLENSFTSENEHVKIESNVDVGLIDVDTAIPLGLVINELITNTKKYAVTINNKCLIQVNLWIDDKKELCLKVSDNGTGKINEKSGKTSTSFGMDLIRILSKKLKGKIEVRTDQGYSIIIRFERYKCVEPVSI